MSMVGAGKATIARITAERFGCKDEALLNLIEKLAAADIVIGKPQLFKSELHPQEPGVLRAEVPFYQLTGPAVFISGSMDGKPFMVTLTGPAVEDFA
jgi:hypothetical protein